MKVINSSMSAWSYFGGVYALSSPDSPRQRPLLKNLRAAGIPRCDVVECLPASKRANDGGGGKSMRQVAAHALCDATCANIRENHMLLVRRAYNAGLTSVVVLEDDCEFTLPFNAAKLARIVRWLQLNDWDLFFFGQVPFPQVWATPRTVDVIRVGTPLLAHAYALSRSGMRKVLKLEHINSHIDKIYASAGGLRKFASFPSMAYQSVPPALFRSLKLPLEFNSVARTLELIAVAAPALLMVVLLLFLRLWCGRGRTPPPT